MQLNVLTILLKLYPPSRALCSVINNRKLVIPSNWSGFFLFSCPIFFLGGGHTLPLSICKKTQKNNHSILLNQPSKHTSSQNNVHIIYLLPPIPLCCVCLFYMIVCILMCEFGKNALGVGLENYLCQSGSAMNRSSEIWAPYKYRMYYC